MEGLGKTGRLPSAAAGVKRLQQCWGCQSIGILLVSVVRKHSWYQYRWLWGRQRQLAQQ